MELKSTLLDKLFQIILYIDDAFTEKVGSNSSITTLREQLVTKLSALLLLRDLLCRVVPTKDFVGRPKFLSADMSGRFVGPINRPKNSRRCEQPSAKGVMFLISVSSFVC